MTCGGCGNTEAYQIHSVYDAGEVFDCCNVCGNLSSIDAGVPDVFLHRAGQKFNNLCDKMGRPYEIQSKRHKKEVMDRLGVQEAGGTVNGARFGTKSWTDGTRAWRKRNFEKDRPMIRETLRAWKEKARSGH